MLIEGREAGTAQEIEFTFESPRPEDLYFLQKRPMVLERAGHLQLDPTSLPSTPPVAHGMGVAGMAYTGRVAFAMPQIEQLAAEDPDAPILLLRPDTVPEDIAMILRVGGVLTSRGGSTSHAAVTAKRLGKTAVVDCRTLWVDDVRARARLGDGSELRPGDRLTIDGRSGRVWRAQP